MGLLTTNLALNMAQSVNINVHQLNETSGTYVININASDEQERIFFPHAEIALFMTADQLKELADKINNFRFKQALRVVPAVVQ